jgi:ADP-ribose pyrophosphatase
MSPHSKPGKLLLTTSRFRVEEVEQPVAGGGTRPRQIVRHPGAVTILPLVDDDHVCLIRNYRVSVERTLIELPAGTLEPGEAPEENARRELIEETGYTAGRIDKLHVFLLSPGILDEWMHLYVARDLALGPAAREPGEEIENLVVPWDEALAMIDRGEIQDAKTLVGLLWWDRARRRAAV